MSTYKTLKYYLFIIALFFLFFNNFTTSLLTFIWVDIILFVLTIITTRSWKRIISAIFAFGFIMACQICFVIFLLNNNDLLHTEGFFRFTMTILLLSFSFLIENICEIKNYQNYFFHGSKHAEILPFSYLEECIVQIKGKSSTFKKAVKFFTKNNIQEIIDVIKKNNSFQYINDGTLTEEYFDDALKTLDDPYVYIILSDTGSVPSKLIALFTDKAYNHSSIAFDKDLKTLVSYNGGEYLQPPGLNAEMVEFLSKKEDAAVYVYKLKVTKEQKEYMINRIKQINTEGSAYNIIGLIIKKSFRKNILYCSQFIYMLLLECNANYFEKKPGDIKPTDFVELDYYRKLEFVYKIDFK